MYEFPPIFRDAWYLYLTSRVVTQLILTLVLALLSIRFIQRRHYYAWVIALALILLTYNQFSAYEFEYRIWLAKIPFVQFCIVLIATGRCLWNAERSDAPESSGAVPLLVNGFLGFCTFMFFALPAVSAPRDVRGRVQCRSNLKQIGLALHNFHDDFDRFPKAARTTASQAELPATSPKAQRSWRVTLLPYLENADLYSRYDSDAAWDSDINLPLSRERISSYDCAVRPSNVDQQQRFLSAYAAVTGPNAAFKNNNFVHIRDISDGTSNTVMVVEACGSQIVWTEPRDVRIDSMKMSVNGPGDQPGRSFGISSSYHRGGSQILLADGSVRFASQDIDPKVLRALMTIDSNDPMPADW